jgi:CubicO group peptidase (beta-lactamase class C family)
MADFTQLNEYLDSLEGKYGVPCCDLLVYQNHKPIYRHMCGYSDTEKKVPISEDNMYWIYSASKVITCTAVLQLIERGAIGLYDNLSIYLPEYKQMNVLENGAIRPAKREIRIFDLLTMQGGLTYNFQTKAIEKIKQDTYNKATTRQIIAAIAETPLAFDPTEGWQYCLGHDVLAAVVEVASGQKFSRYLQENIFDPLGMTDIVFKLSPDHRERLAALYRYDFEQHVFKNIPGDNMFDLSDEYESGGAGLACTVDAYGLFVDAMSNYGVGANGARILSKSSIDMMRENRLTGKSLDDFKKGGKVGYGYGLGVRTLIDQSKSLSPLKEFGWDGAACAYVLIDPENNLGIFMAMHTLMFIKAYFEIHPMIRDLTYSALGIGKKETEKTLA